MNILPVALRGQVKLGLVLTALAVPGGCQPSFYYNCHDGSDIATDKQLAITAASVQFARAALTGDLDTAYGQFTEAARANTSKDQLAGAMQAFASAGPFDHFQVERIITLTGWGDTSQGNGVAICSKDALHPEKGATVAMQKIPEQAYALVAAKGSQETWISSVWLIPHSGKWEVNAFHTTMETVLDKGADEYLAIARTEKTRGHNLNAGLLYSDAASIAGRGPFYRTGVEEVIRREAAEVQDPQEFRGHPPFLLTGSSGTFSITRVFTVPLNGKLYLKIAHGVDRWKDSGEIESKNRDLNRTFAKRFPEYSDVFGGIIAEATARGSTDGWRTIEENAAILREKSPSPRN